jgi:phage baseplate assembly protein W
MPYHSFSTVGRGVADTQVSGIEAVKADLLNNLNVRFREVPGRPYFGSGIQALASQPFDGATQAAVVAELRRVFAGDPRVSVGEIVSSFSSGVLVLSALVYYVELGYEEWMDIAVRP